ncbi:hypothetical protein BC937DRAFT_87192 [Endogone sp. FLAS-F59071]|nr:hypothetical protein BC937DRAFT_87192 [Endogone sp. FLAS-F59071]|eukprot:RUS12719.1 hypothetical protein BC937DRAFT_87192 [Endogone sp. FLAS-F59071]
MTFLIAPLLRPLLTPKEVPLTYLSTIQQPLYPITVVASALFLLTFFFITVRHPFITTDKQRAYLLTAVSSTITTSGALNILYRFWRSGWDLSALSYESPIWFSLTVFFQTFLVVDLAVGLVYYRKRIDPLTGWTHHIIYYFTLWWVMSCRLTQLFGIMCLLEAPTLALALGSINPKWRKDMVFASLFVSTRLVFHGFMLYMLYNYHPMPQAVLVLGFFYPVHVYWFFGFVKQQQRLARKRAAAVKEASVSAVESTATTTATKLSTPAVVAQLQSELRNRMPVMVVLPRGFVPENPRKMLVDATARRVLNHMPERFRSERIDRWVDRMAGMDGGLVPVAAY